VKRGRQNGTRDAIDDREVVGTAVPDRYGHASQTDAGLWQVAAYHHKSEKLCRQHHLALWSDPWAR